ncbi:hypothetical protein ACFL2P_02535, partial [Candidatus Moduliflexota bacterium]
HGEAAVPWLIEAVGSDLAEVRKRSASALADLTGESIGEDLTAWRDWWEERAGELPGDRQIDGR